MITAIRKICRVGNDVSLVIPVGIEEAGAEVEVTIIPNKTAPKMSSQMTPQEHAAFIDSIAGTWIGDFPEISDPPIEIRDPL